MTAVLQLQGQIKSREEGLVRAPAGVPAAVRNRFLTRPKREENSSVEYEEYDGRGCDCGELFPPKSNKGLILSAVCYFSFPPESNEIFLSGCSALLITLSQYFVKCPPEARRI